MVSKRRITRDTLIGLLVITTAFIIIVASSPLGEQLYDLIISEPETCPPAYILPNGLPSDYNCTGSLNYSAYWENYVSPYSSLRIFEYYNQTTASIDRIETRDWIELSYLVADNLNLGHITDIQALCYTTLLVEWYI